MNSPYSDFKVNRLLPIVKHKRPTFVILTRRSHSKKGYVFTHIFVFILQFTQAIVFKNINNF